MSKKTFFDFDNNLTENYRLKNMFGGLNMGSQAVDDGNSDHFYIGWANELRRLNAFIGAIARGRYIDPDSVIANLRTKLFVMGIVFDPVSIGDQEEGQHFLPLRQYEGIRRNTETGDIEEVNYLDEAFPNGVYLHLNWYPDETGMTKLSGKIITGEELDRMAQDDEELAAALSESMIEEECGCDDDEEEDGMEDDMEDGMEDDDDLTESALSVYRAIDNHPKKKISELPKEQQAKAATLVKQMKDNQKSGDPEKTVVAYQNDKGKIGVYTINSQQLKNMLLSKSGFVLTEDVINESFKLKQKVVDKKTGDTGVIAEVGKGKLKGVYLIVWDNSKKGVSSRNEDEIKADGSIKEGLTSFSMFNEAQKTGGDKAYQEFLAKKLKSMGYETIKDIPDDEKDDFFNSVDKEWKADDEGDSMNEAVMFKSLGSDEYDIISKGKSVGRIRKKTGSFEADYMIGKQRMIHHTGSGSSLKTVDDLKKVVTKNLVKNLTEAAVSANPISFKVKKKLDNLGSVTKIDIKANKVTMIGWDKPESLSVAVGVTPKSVEILTKGTKKIQRAVYADGSVLEVSVGADPLMSKTVGVGVDDDWVGIKAMAPMKEEVGDKEEYQKKVKKALKDAGYDSIKDIPDDEKDDFFNKLDSMHVSDDEEAGISEGFKPSLASSGDETDILVNGKKIGKIHKLPDGRYEAVYKMNGVELKQHTGTGALSLKTVNDLKKFVMNNIQKNMNEETEGTERSLMDLLAEASQVEASVWKDIEKLSKMTDRNDKTGAAIHGAKTLMKQASPEQVKELKRLQGRFEHYHGMENGMNGMQSKDFQGLVTILWQKAKEVLPDKLAKAFKDAF